MEKKNYSIDEIKTMTPENAGKVLMDECRKDYPDMDLLIHILKDSPVDVNMQDSGGSTALIWASTDDKIGVVQLLLEHPKIDVNAQRNTGQTALMMASYNGRVGIVRLLLAHPKINKWFMHKKKTAWHWAMNEVRDAFPDLKPPIKRRK